MKRQEYLQKIFSMLKNNYVSLYSVIKKLHKREYCYLKYVKYDICEIYIYKIFHSPSDVQNIIFIFPILRYNNICNNIINIIYIIIYMNIIYKNTIVILFFFISIYFFTL